MAAAAPELPEGFDLEALLAPIPGDAPQGTDLREDSSAQSPWFRLRDARAEAREIERRAETDGGGDESAVPQPWRTINTLARGALLEKSKDLDVAAMLTEALLRMHGLPGLTAGSLLIQGLAERYWDVVFPLPDEFDGVAARVMGVSGLSGSEKEGLLLPALRRMPLFRRPDGTGFAWWIYEGAREVAALDEARKKARLSKGAIEMDAVENEARAVGAAHFGVLRRRLREASAAWGGMGATLDERAGSDGPSTGRVRDLLAEMLEFTAKFAPPDEVEPTEEEAAAADGEGAEAGEGGEGGGGGSGGGRKARSREDYLKLLSEIADFFKKGEPNSPLAYTLQEAVRRARMSWPELLAELVPDQNARTQIIIQLGIKPSDGSG